MKYIYLIKNRSNISDTIKIDKKINKKIKKILKIKLVSSK